MPILSVKLWRLAVQLELIQTYDLSTLCYASTLDGV
jgi:hypothetical protein